MIAKTYSLLVMLLLTLTVESQCYEVSAPITDVCRTPNGTLFAVAGGGTIRKSMDSGNTWELLDPKVTGDFYSVFFINDLVGIACGESGVMRTVDGGKNWSLALTSPNPFQYLHFTNESTGYVINSVGDIFKTTDGGITWNTIHFSYGVSTAYSNYYNQVFFVNNQKGFVCSTSNSSDGGKIYITKDAGANWEQVLEHGHYVYFIDEQNGYAIKNANTICKTSDGGDTWTEIHVGVQDYLTEIKFNGKIGYATGAAGSILKTYDGGITWIFQKSGIEFGLGGITFNESGLSAVAVGSNATILKTENGGAKWNLISMGPPSSAYCKAGCFTDERTAYILTTKNHLVKTTDGGVTWKPIELPTNDLMKDICFINPSTGFVGGSKSTLLKTSDAGLSWQKIPVPTDIGIIYALNENEIFAFGYGFYKTKNGGQTWTQSFGGNTSPNGTGARTFHFVNDSLIFMVTGNGIYVTTNRGDSWHAGTPAECNICPAGYLITHFEKKIFVASDKLYTSEDEGKSWTEIKSLPYGDPVDIYFTDDQNGYLLRGYTDFYKTTNGGFNFTHETFRESNISLTGLAFSGSYGLVFGSDGRIYRPYRMAGKFVGVPETQANLKKRLMIYPNPSKEILTVSCPDCVQGSMIEIYDAGGRIVYSKAIENSEVEQLDVSQLPVGCYSLKAGSSFARFIRN